VEENHAGEIPDTPTSTRMFLFEVVWEGAMSAYSAIFGLDEIRGKTPMIQEARNMRVEKLVLAVVGQRDFDT
jgi:hypothetical protein